MGRLFLFLPALFAAFAVGATSLSLSPSDPLSLQSAVDSGADTILLAPGIYDVTETVVVSSAVTIVGTAPGAAAIVRFAKKANGYSSSRVFRLKHEGAVLRNLAITTPQPAESYAMGVKISAGLVDSCVITNCNAQNGSYDGGGGVWLSGGVVTNCLIHANNLWGAGGLKTYGANVYMKGGLVVDCVITKGATHNRTNVYGGGVCMAGGTLRNCLVAENVAAEGEGCGVRVESGSNTIENCTIVANAAPSSSTGSGLYIKSDANNLVAVRNTIVWDNTCAGGTMNWTRSGTKGFVSEGVVTVPLLDGTNNTTADPLFADALHGDWRATLGGAYNAGVVLDWMAGAHDLDGHARVLDGAPDAGCYEFDPGTLACAFDVAAGGARDLDHVVLTAHVAGSDTAGLVYAWRVVDGLGHATTRAGAEYSTLDLDLAAGVYDVTLDVTNANHVAASFARPAVVTVFPNDIYVSLSGSNLYPYGSYATGATNLIDAVAAATDGTTIHVAEGFHRIATSIHLNDAIRLVSENGPERTFIFGTNTVSGQRMVNIANAGAMLSGFTVTGIDSSQTTLHYDVYDFATRKSITKAGVGYRPTVGGVKISRAGGVVTNCWIVNHRGGAGAGLAMYGGTAVDCLFSNNWAYCTGGSGSRGAGLLLDDSSAVADRCVFMSNCVYYGSTSYGGGACVNNGTLRNCLFVGNHCTDGYGGNFAAMSSSAHVYHCTAVDGMGSKGYGGIYVSGGGDVRECLSYNNVGNGTREDTDDPGFADYAGGDFHLSVASPAVDAAAPGLGGDLDLDHRPRTRGSAADKGCYELDASGFSIGVSYSADDPFSDTPVVLSAVVTPAGTSLDAAWWTFDGSEPSASRHDATGPSVVRTFAPGVWTVRFKATYNGTTYALDRPNWFTRYGRTVYLVAENADAAFPYGTRATAATNLNEALACALDGATLLVDDGVYASSAQEINYALTVRSVHGPDYTTFDGNNKGSSFVVNHADVVFDGIRFWRGKGYIDSGAVRLNATATAAMVTNCVFDSCRVESYGGGGAVLYAGTLVDCVFTNCSLFARDQSGAALVAKGNAFVDRCQFLDSGYTGDIKADGAVCLEGSAVMRNSVVARSSLSGTGGIVAKSHAQVLNCTVTWNRTSGEGMTGGVAVSNSSVVVRNTIAWGNRNDATDEVSELFGPEGCFDHVCTEDPRFRRGKRPFDISTDSPCRHAGVTEEWMAGAKDVYGRARLFSPNKPVDIGAAACSARAGVVLRMR